MQSFILDRHTDPSNPTMKVTQDDKIPIYDSKADAEADLANIEEGGIVATKDTGATEKVVDVVQDGNMNPVTSNAVYDVLPKASREGHEFRIERYGKVRVIIAINVQASDLTTLPEADRPLATVRGFCSKNYNNNVFIATAEPNGTIHVFNAQYVEDTSGENNFNITYVVA